MSIKEDKPDDVVTKELFPTDPAGGLMQSQGH